MKHSLGKIETIIFIFLLRKMAIKFVDNFSIEGHGILTLEPEILLGEAVDIARENLCNVLIRSYKGWELKREKKPAKVSDRSVTSYIIPDKP